MPDPTPHNPDPHSSEELVAYLDGELSREQSESVEQQVRDDEQLRHQMQQYDRVWNALDGLPRTTVGDNFTQTTIEMVAVEAQKSLTEQTALMPVRKRNRRWQLTGLCAAGVLLGGLLMAMVMPNPNRTLYLNLPVITQLDAYNEIRDVEFLRALQNQEGLLAEWVPQIEEQAEALAQVTSASYRGRMQYVDNLGNEPRTDLANKARRYAGMSPPMREELSQRHETIAAAPDAEQLQRTMLAYYAWVSRLTELEQAQLRSLSTRERVAQVGKIQERLDRQSELRLTPDNAIALRDAFEALASDRKILALHKKFIGSLPNYDGTPMPDDRRERWQRGMVKFIKGVEPRQANYLVLWRAAAGDVPLEGFQDYRSAIERQLLTAIDASTADRLREMSVRDRSRLLSYWLAESKRRKKPDVATLEAFFISGKIPAEKQQELLSMPKDKMLRHLEQLYVQEFLGDENLDEDLRRHFRGFYARDRDRRGPPPGTGDRDGRGPRDRNEHRDRPAPRDSDRRGPPGRPD